MARPFLTQNPLRGLRLIQLIRIMTYIHGLPLDTPSTYINLTTRHSRQFILF
jgi:hypothetical protein